MEIDPPPDSTNSTWSRDLFLKRLALLGIPEVSLKQLQPGLVKYVKENKHRIPEIVSAFLPTELEAMEYVLVAETDSTRALGGESVNILLSESMVWLQWLMFLGEPSVVLKHLEKMATGQRGVCGAVWGTNDIAYRCRTCEHDPTCAICVPCFQNGNHKGHDYSIIYTGGGCCDCGDVTAWKRAGFCSKHKGAEQIQPLCEEIANSVEPILDALLLYWKTKLLSAENIHQESPGSDDNIMDLKKFTDELTSVVVDMLVEFCMYSESLLSFVSGRVISLVGLLDILVRAERFLSNDVVKKLQELLLKFLSEPTFKYEFAKSFLSYYPAVVNEAVKESKDVIFKKYPLLSTFSVQLFTVPTLTPRLVKEMDLLAILLECLSNIFNACAGDDGRLQVSKWGNLYETTIRVVEDIRFVMSHSVVPKYVTHGRRDILRTWMKLLAFVQGMNPQKRETNIHIEDENDYMHLPFVLCHSIENIHALLVAGAFSATSEETDNEALLVAFKHDFEDQDSLRHAKVGRLSQESSVWCMNGRSTSGCELKTVGEISLPNSVFGLIFECLRAIENWLGVDNTSGPVLSILSSKSKNTPANNFLALKGTLSKIRKGRNILKSYNSLSPTSKLASSRESHSNAASHSSGMECGPSDLSLDSFDYSVVEGDYANELESLRVLGLTDWPDIVYDVSSQDISVHIPLHRLLSLVLQRALKKSYGEPASPDMTNASSVDSSPAIYHDFFGHVLGGCHPHGFSAFLMEHPLRIRVFCSEVHAGMWRKNGDAAILSYEWYRSVRWSEQGLELDLFLLQCCAALAPADLYVSRILERFGLSSYLSLNLERSSEFEPVLVQEMLNLIIQIVKERRFCGLTPAQCLRRELIYKLSTGNATRSQLVKSLPRDLSKVDQLQEVLDTVAEYVKPSGISQGMYKLRLACWKELDLYHPRWNSRDLQAAEERYMRFCNVSALTSQLPKWTNIYRPLTGLARIATCKSVLQIVRAVLFYALFTDKLTASRAPDGVLLTALHLLSLALDICYLQKEFNDLSCSMGDSIPLLAYADETISWVHHKGCDDQSLLSLLVSLMRINKKENLYHSMEPGGFDLSSLIKVLLKKFAELDTGCFENLQELAPEVVDQLSKSRRNPGASNSDSVSENDKRKAKARERQAAIMEKMRAQQSKFMANVNSVTDDGAESSLMDDVCSDDVGHDSEGSEPVICSLCHDQNSKSPVSYLIHIQKSRLLSLLDKGPPSWVDVQRSGKEPVSTSGDQVEFPSLENPIATNSEALSSSQLMHLIQNAVNEFAANGQPREVNAFFEFVKIRFPSVRNIRLPSAVQDTRETIASSLESFEENMYLLILERMNDSGEYVLVENKVGASSSSENDESLLLGKYIASLSKEILDNSSSSENVRSRSSKTGSESVTSLPAYDGFGPADFDGVYLSSCGHAVHQACLDRYLLSLKERHTRRIDFEGGHIVDPDQGEFLCPVCRGLANSVLPELPEGAEKLRRLSGTLTEKLDSFKEAGGCLRVQEGLSLLQAAADVAARNDILKAFPMQRNGRIPANLESVFHLLCEMYFPGSNKIMASGRVSHPLIMWDTLKYSIISTEVSARSRRTSLATNYDLGGLFKEFQSSSGFILSLLLKIVQSSRAQSSLSVLLRFRGLQLFRESVCSGVSQDEFPSRSFGSGGNMLCILENAELELRYPDVQFWTRASDPVLARDAFSSLMWILFALPYPFLSCKKSFFSLVHVFYVVSITQAIIVYFGKHRNSINFEYQDCVISDIFKFFGGHGFPHQYFGSNYIDDSHDIKDLIRTLTFPYLRRCALLWSLINSSSSAPFSGAHLLDISPQSSDFKVDHANGFGSEPTEIEKLEDFFEIPLLDSILSDESLCPLVSKWLHHFSTEFNIRTLRWGLHLTPVVPFRLMILPHLYQDLLQRYIKQPCVDCGVIQDEPVLCLLCGRMCSQAWKPCCRKSNCQTHAMACGAGTGVFLLIRRTTILLQRSLRLARWPSPYLDAFGEEDLDMLRGKPLYLNEERYAALTHMVASHGLDRSSRVLHQTTVGAFLML